MKKRQRKFWTTLRKVEDKAERYNQEGIAVVVASLCMALTANNVNRFAEHCLTFHDVDSGKPFDILASVRVRGGDDAGSEQEQR